MPSVNKYKNKNGFYIKSRQGGHWCTYQVTAQGEEELKKAGLAFGGDISAAELNTLRERGLIYTNGSGPGGVDDDLVAERAPQPAKKRPIHTPSVASSRSSSSRAETTPFAQWPTVSERRTPTAQSRPKFDTIPLLHETPQSDVQPRKQPGDQIKRLPDEIPLSHDGIGEDLFQRIYAERVRLLDELEGHKDRAVQDSELIPDKLLRRSEPRVQNQFDLDSGRHHRLRSEVPTSIPDIRSLRPAAHEGDFFKVLIGAIISLLLIVLLIIIIVYIGSKYYNN